MVDVLDAINKVVLTAEDDTAAGYASATARANAYVATIGGAASTLKGLFAALGVGTFVAMIEGAIEAEAQLGRLADRAGMTVEALSSLRMAAHEGGISLEEVVTGSDRLQKALFEATDGTTKAAQALQLLGLDAKELSLLAPSDQLKVLADRLAQFQDGGTKTAIVMELLGRSGAQFQAFLKALAQDGTTAALITREQADAAREAEAQFAKLADNSTKLKIALANELLPAIVEITSALVKMGEESTLSGKASALLEEDLNLAGRALRALFAPQISILLALFGDGTQRATQETKNWGGEMNRARDSLASLDAVLNTATVDLNKLNSVIASIEGKDLGIGAGFQASFQVLTQAVNAGVISLDRYRQLTAALLNQQPWAEKQAAAARRLGEEQQRILDQIQAYIGKLMDETNALSQDSVEAFRYQAALNGLKNWQTEVLLDERMRAIDVSNQLKAANDALVKGWQANDAAMARLQADQDAYNDSLLNLDKSLQLQLDTLGMSSTAAQAFALQQQLDAAAAEGNTVAVQRLTKALETLNQIDIKQKALDDAKEMQRAYEETANSIEQALERGFNDAFQKGKNFAEGLRDALKNLFDRLVLRPIIQPVAASLAGGLQSLFGFSAPNNSLAFSGGAGGFNLSSLPGIGALFSSGGYGATAGMLGTELGSGAAEASLFGSAAGEGVLAGGALAGAASFIPYVGLAIAAYEILKNTVFKHEPTPASGQFGILPGSADLSQFEDQASTTTKNFGGLQVGFLDQGTQEFSGEAAQVFNKVVAGAIDSFATRFSPAQSAQFADVLKNMTFQAFSGTFTTEDFLQKYGGQILQQVVTSAFGILDPALAKVMGDFKGTADEVAKFANTLLALYDATKNLPDAVKASIEGALDGTQATADKVLAFAQIFATFGSTLPGVGDSLGKLSGTDIPAFIDSLGGADAALKQFDFVYANFTTSAQKSADASKQLNDAFAGLGLAVPKTHADFLALLNSFDLTTKAGRAMYAAVLALAPAFVAVKGTADQAAGGVDKLTNSIVGMNDAIDSANPGLQDFYTSAQKTADNTKTLNDAFAALGVSVPQTHEDFLKLLDSIDRTTPAGEALYEAIFKLAPLFIQVHGTADQAAASLNNVTTALTAVANAGVGAGEIQNAAQKFVSKFLQQVNTIVDAGTGDFGAKTSQRIGLIGDEITTLQAQYDSYVANVSFGVIDATAVQLQTEIDSLKNTNAGLIGDLAQFTTLKAQYGASIAEQLVALQNWYDQQKRIVGGNADLLAALNDVFKQKWDAIIAGTSSGVDGALSALQKLQQGIAQYLQGLQVGQLSPLTPQQRLASAQQSFQVELAKALTGDQTALGDITKYSDTYLQQAAGFYTTSSQAYQDIFKNVTGALGGLAGTSPTGTTTLDPTTKAILAAVPTNAKIVSSDDLATQITKLIAAINAAIAALANANSADSQEATAELKAELVSLQNEFVTLK